MQNYEVMKHIYSLITQNQLSNKTSNPPDSSNPTQTQNRNSPPSNSKQKPKLNKNSPRSLNPLKPLHDPIIIRFNRRPSLFLLTPKLQIILQLI